MRARVQDKESGRFLKSDVYAILNTGWFARYLVLVPNDTGSYFRLFDFLDKSCAPYYPPLVNEITPDRPAEWVGGDEGLFSRVQALLVGKDVRFDWFHGYPWVLEKPELLAKLLLGESVNTEECGFPLIDTRLPGWHYVETQEDVDTLMETAGDFHDSVLKSLEYISGSRVYPDKSMTPIDSLRKLKMIFESQCTDTIELLFEGLIALNLRPKDDNWTTEITEASVFLNEETVFFAEDEMEKEEFQPDRTCAKAYSLRWRLVPHI